VLGHEENFAGLAAISRELISRAESLSSPQRVVLDMDSTEIPVLLREIACGSRRQAVPCEI
jgi:hypothetical protein